MDGAFAGALPYLRNCAGGEMSGELAHMADKQNGKYLTAGILAVIALSLFLFTLYNGLN
jgi:hypothetical protein